MMVSKVIALSVALIVIAVDCRRPPIEGAKLDLREGKNLFYSNHWKSSTIFISLLFCVFVSFFPIIFQLNEIGSSFANRKHLKSRLLIVKV